MISRGIKHPKGLADLYDYAKIGRGEMFEETRHVK
jgi:hypothetical protein